MSESVTESEDEDSDAVNHSSKDAEISAMNIKSRNSSKDSTAKK